MPDLLWPEDESRRRLEGAWEQDPQDPSLFRLHTTADGTLVSKLIDRADNWHLSAARGEAGRFADGDARRFPVGFAYHNMKEGTRLVDPPAQTSQPWLPPHGASLEGLLRGLRETPHRLLVKAPLAMGAARVSAAPLKQMPLPPSGGNFEFVVGRFKAQRDSVLALDRNQGLLYAWMSRAAKWLPFSWDDGSHPNLTCAWEAASRWAMEMRQTTANGVAETVLYLPTADGLAEVRPNVLGLGSTGMVKYAGHLIGAPAMWRDKLWLPETRRLPGGQSVLALRQVDEPAPEPLIVGQAPAAPDLYPPLCSQNLVVWASKEGQLVLERGAGNAPVARWLDWPGGFTPLLDAWSPYFMIGPSFWQVGWFGDDSGRFGYLRLGAACERYELDRLRLNTKNTVYEAGARLTLERAWHSNNQVVQPDQARNCIYPLLESGHHQGVVGLEMRPVSSGDWFRHDGDIDTTVFYEDSDTARIELDRGPLQRPWQARAFVFDGALCMYHPSWPKLHRWQLESP